MVLVQLKNPDSLRDAGCLVRIALLALALAPLDARPKITLGDARRDERVRHLEIGGGGGDVRGVVVFGLARHPGRSDRERGGDERLGDHSAPPSLGPFPAAAAAARREARRPVASLAISSRGTGSTERSGSSTR